jgi:hypothetical protein
VTKIARIRDFHRNQALNQLKEQAEIATRNPRWVSGRYLSRQTRSKKKTQKIVGKQDPRQAENVYEDGI